MLQEYWYIVLFLKVIFVILLFCVAKTQCIKNSYDVSEQGMKIGVREKAITGHETGTAGTAVRNNTAVAP